MTISEPKSAHLREVLLFAFNWKKSATEAHRMLEEVYGNHAMSKSQCHDNQGNDIHVHVVQAMIIMQFDFALTNARAPFGYLHSLVGLEPTARARSLFSPLQFHTKDTSLVSLVLAEQPLVMELPLVSPASCELRWVREFKNDRTDVHDEPRAGRPSVSDETVAKVEAAMLEDRRVTVRKLCDLVPDVSKTTIDKNLREHLGYSKNKRRGMLTKGVRFHHDNARPHTAHQTTALIEEFGWELVSHPPYSPDVAPSDFHFFLELKKNLGGT
ncbi:hypothetical protein LAZ67_7002750 [Cordylochernes scorpioides]|uniref:Mos1 transposase HTH domain-containing protein n=1 Tax=Cordylochernes scorpioides TaxID=51811 RepID=A0ABY6KQ07_9ARAC|nr:hypothetical protein LAZ67_7002750 [Cordylochernes scorpioides]